MMEGDDFPSVEGVALAGFGGVLVELEALANDAPQVLFSHAGNTSLNLVGVTVGESN
ncbi:MAG: hypothetical protein WCE62_20590 [Polyangiales bacterium]